MSATILTWNLERKKVSSPYGKMAIDHLFEQSPDVMAVSETRTDFPTNNGFTVFAQHPNGHHAANERKILIWSKNPWSEVDNLGDKALPIGRFISGVTKTPIGEVRVVGVCIPYHMADVVYGTKDKKPWEQHITFLKILPSILQSYTRPILIAGDFNQRIPRAKYGNRIAALEMQKAFNDYNIITKGIINNLSRAGIDHIAIDEKLKAEKILGWPNIINDKRLSDHDGAGCELTFISEFP